MCVGLMGKTRCEVCADYLAQPQIKYVSASVYHYALGRRDMRYDILTALNNEYKEAAKERCDAEEEDDDSNETSWHCGYCAGLVEAEAIADRGPSSRERALQTNNEAHGRDVR